MALEVTPLLENLWYTNGGCALIRREELNYLETKAKTDKYGSRGDEFNLDTWNMEEINLLKLGVAKYGCRWWILVAANFVKTRWSHQCATKYKAMCPEDYAAGNLLRKAALSRESRMAQDYRGMVFAFGNPYNPTRLATEYSPDKFPLRLNDPGVHEIFVQHKISTKNCEMCDTPFTDNEWKCVDHFHCEATKRAQQNTKKKKKFDSVKAG